MHATSISPLSVKTLTWQPRANVFALTVVCKAVFTLRPGESRLSEVQAPPHGADVYWEDDTRRSLRLACDLVPFKRHAEVLVGGHAYAPHGQPTTTLVAKVTLGEWTKAIEVHGDRYWTVDGRLSAATPFVKMPLRWERAAGGPGTWNPVGLSPGILLNAHGLRSVPNLLPVGLLLRGPGQEIPPAGFGPLAPLWPERMAKLRQHAAVWRYDGWMSAPLPEDVDAVYFNAAPPDQQMAQIPVGERIVLENLHPKHPRLVTVLERVTPQAVVQRGSGEVQDVRLRCDTMWIDTDTGTCALIWRGAVPLQHPEETGTVIVTADRAGEDEDAATGTVVLPMMSTILSDQPAVPFARPEPGTPSAAPQAALELQPARATPEDPGTGTLVGGLVAAAPLPFTVQTPNEKLNRGEVTNVERREVDESTITIVAPLDASALLKGPVMPFADVAPGEITSLQTGEPEPTTERRTNVDPATSTQWLGGTVTPMSPLPFGAESGADAHRMPVRVEEPAALPVATSTKPPAPPEFVGPIPVAVSRTHEVATSEEKKAATEEKKLPVEEYPIDRCAGISARMALGKEDRYAILEGEKLKEEQWQALHAHWLAEIKAEAGRGEKKMLLAYDEGYVGALERECGPLGPKEYAKLVVAAERGREAEVLEGMGLPRGVMMRIRRVWLERMVRDKRMGREVRYEMAANRTE